MSQFQGTLTGTLTAQDSLGDTYDSTVTASLGVDLTSQSGGAIDVSATISGEVYQTNHYYNGTSYSFTQAIGPYSGSGVTNITNFDVPLGPLTTAFNGITLTETATLSTDQIDIAVSANFSIPRTVYPNGVTKQITYYGNASVGGTIPSVACFLSGTHLLSGRGTIAVEAVNVGEHLAAKSGALRPVRWIGCHTVDCLAHSDPSTVRPVKVRASAFGSAVPVRDLLLSPDHAVFVAGVLIPIRCLINGMTIVQVAAERVTYWHVELPDHDVILAEGLPCESYLDTGNRAAFANVAPAAAIPPGRIGKSTPSAADTVELSGSYRLSRAARVPVNVPWKSVTS